MGLIERNIVVSRAAEGLYFLQIEGCESILVKADALSRLLSIVYGLDMPPYRPFVEGVSGRFHDRRHVTDAQLKDVQILIEIYRRYN
jgi:hypothetical protein